MVVPYISIRSPGRCAPTLRASAPGVHGAGDDGDARGQSGAAGGLVRDGARGLTGPAQRRQFESGGDAVGPGRVPLVRDGVVERGRLARRVVVEHIAAGQLAHEPGTGGVEPPGTRVQLRFLVRDPGDLGAGGLAAQVGAAAAPDVLGAQLRSEAGDLVDGAGVDAVEDRGAEGHVVGIGEQDAGAHAADSDGDGPGVGRAGQLPGEGGQFVPPDTGVHLHPPRSRRSTVDGVLAHGGGQQRAVQPHQYALAAGGADVHTQDCVERHGGRLPGITGRVNVFPAQRSVTGRARRPAGWRGG